MSLTVRNNLPVVNSPPLNAPITSSSNSKWSLVKDVAQQTLKIATLVSVLSLTAWTGMQGSSVDDDASHSMPSLTKHNYTIGSPSVDFTSSCVQTTFLSILGSLAMGN